MSSSELTSAKELQKLQIHPDEAEFPWDSWRRLVREVLETITASSLRYAADPCGYLPLRAALCNQVGVARGIRYGADNFVVVNSTTQALDTIAQALLSAGDTVIMEDPSFGGLRHISISKGVHVTSVATDDYGLVPELLPAPLPGRASGRVILYANAAFQAAHSPVPIQRQRQIVCWASQNDAIIIEDNYNADFRFASRALPTLQALDEEGRVIILGNFSKTMMPCLSLGYLVVPDRLLSLIASTKFFIDRHSPSPEQLFLHQFIESGLYARHVNKMRRAYAEKRDSLIDSLKKHMATTLEILPESLSLFVRVRLPGLAEGLVLEAAEQAGLTVLSGTPLYMEAPEDQYFISFARADAGSISGQVADFAARVRRK